MAMPNRVGGPPAVAPRPVTDKPDILWSNDAVKQLEQFDRYIRSDVQRKFRDDPMKNAVQIDAASHSHRTPIEGTRVTVLWTLDPQTNKALVNSFEVAPKPGVGGWLAGLIGR